MGNNIFFNLIFLRYKGLIINSSSTDRIVQKDKNKINVL